MNLVIRRHVYDECRQKPRVLDFMQWSREYVAEGTAGEVREVANQLFKPDSPILRIAFVRVGAEAGACYLEEQRARRAMAAWKGGSRLLVRPAARHLGADWRFPEDRTGGQAHRRPPLGYHTGVRPGGRRSKRRLTSRAGRPSGSACPAAAYNHGP